jgi:hypothetical protein
LRFSSEAPQGLSQEMGTFQPGVMADSERRNELPAHLSSLYRTIVYIYPENEWRVYTGMDIDT